MALTDEERRSLAAIQDGLTRTRRGGVLRPWRGSLWHAVLRLRAVLPLLAVLVGCGVVTVGAVVLLPAGVAAAIAFLAGAAAVQLGTRAARGSRPARR